VIAVRWCPDVDRSRDSVDARRRALTTPAATRVVSKDKGWSRSAPRICPNFIKCSESGIPEPMRCCGNEVLVNVKKTLLSVSSVGGAAN
jgi:hypothetical protein